MQSTSRETAAGGTLSQKRIEHTMIAAPARTEIDPSLLRALLTDEVFRPAEPKTLEQTGLSEALVQSLLCKQLAICGQASGRST